MARLMIIVLMQISRCFLAWTLWAGTQLVRLFRKLTWSFTARYANVTLAHSML